MTTLCEQTLLVDALAADEATFDRLVAAAPVFRRFASVLMREDTAGRLTLADIANMAGVPVTTVVSAARGGPDQPESGSSPTADPLPEGRPAWLAQPEDEASRFDARSLLQAGHEPLPDILDLAEATSPTAVLIVDATFHPQPLRRLFEGRGYESAAERLAPDHWRVYFRRPA